jgi:hypothetical protein
MSSAAPGPQRPPAPADLILQVSAGFIASISLNVAVELGIADHLSGPPRPVADLARATSTNEDALYRILRLLASLGIFTEAAPRAFAHTPASETLRTGVPGSMRDLTRFWSDPFHFRVYAELLHSVRTGEPCADKVLGMPVFDYFSKDARESELFNAAMTSFSAIEVPAALAVYDFSGIGTLVDIAGGHGYMICAILQKYPQMRGILTDLEHVLKGSAENARTFGVESRLTTQSCDFFKSAPAGGDAYIMKHIIHDWDDDKAGLILRNIHTALGPRRGKVILLEMVLTPGNDPHPAKFLDIEMLALPKGRERTADEFGALFARAGFELARIVPTQSPVCVIEAVKV